MEEKIKIIADNKIPFLKGVFEPFAEIEYHKGSEITKEIVQDADALIIRTRTKCDEELFKNSNVKFIGTATIGIDHIDTAFCKFKGIKWINAPGCNSSSVQQYLASALLTLSKLKNLELDKMTIGIVGVGNVGSKVEKIANILGMKVLLNDPPRERLEGSEKFVSLDRLIEQSDIITFHVPLNRNGIDRTFHLADEEFFSKFEKSKVLINTSRGEVIETSALKGAISSGKVTASVLDVWEKEPNIDLGLLKIVDIATPHIAGYSADGKANGTSVCVNALNNFFNLGLPENWFPENIPLPIEGLKVDIECKNKSLQDLIFEIILSTYDIRNDDINLRKSPETFEAQRGNYPIRREFQNYIVNISNGNDKFIKVLRDLNFKLTFMNN
jgi:erythronate-4-phosphate dehydrogenase